MNNNAFDFALAELPPTSISPFLDFSGKQLVLQSIVETPIEGLFQCILMSTVLRFKCMPAMFTICQFHNSWSVKMWQCSRDKSWKGNRFYLNFVFYFICQTIGNDFNNRRNCSLENYNNITTGPDKQRSVWFPVGLELIIASIESAFASHVALIMCRLGHTRQSSEHLFPTKPGDKKIIKYFLLTKYV